MTKIVATYPAYDIVEAPVHGLTGLPRLKADDTLALENNNHLGTFTIGSVASSALEEGDCPFYARERALGFGHDLHFIFANASCISSQSRAKETHIEVHYGMKVLFEGIIFTIEKDHNNNLKLVQVDTYHDIIERRVAESKKLQEQ